MALLTPERWARRSRERPRRTLSRLRLAPTTGARSPGVSCWAGAGDLSSGSLDLDGSAVTSGAPYAGPALPGNGRDGGGLREVVSIVVGSVTTIDTRSELMQDIMTIIWDTGSSETGHSCTTVTPRGTRARSVAPMGS